MTKDEARLSVMGAISMALKDPILQQGFEIICKENAELKKEIDYAKEYCLFSDCEKVKRLEAQSEKLKKCDNCKENTVLNPYCIDCENKSKWDYQNE